LHIITYSRAGPTGKRLTAAILDRCVIRGAPGAAASRAKPVATSIGKSANSSIIRTTPGTSKIAASIERISKAGWLCRENKFRIGVLAPFSNIRAKTVTRARPIKKSSSIRGFDRDDISDSRPVPSGRSAAAAGAGSHPVNAVVARSVPARGPPPASPIPDRVATGRRA
jgi:hypothetical protein